MHHLKPASFKNTGWPFGCNGQSPMPECVCIYKYIYIYIYIYLGWPFGCIGQSPMPECAWARPAVEITKILYVCVYVCERMYVCVCNTHTHTLLVLDPQLKSRKSCMYVCMYVCVCVCVYIYIHTQSSSLNVPSVWTKRRVYPSQVCTYTCTHTHNGVLPK